MRRLLYVLVICLVVLVVGAAIGYALLSHGALSADRAPGRLETAMARRIVYLSIPRSQRDAPNPFAGDPNAWKDGADHFADHCAVCHGSDGRGQSEFGPRMYPPVPDLTDPFVQGMSDGALFAIIQHGVRWTGMPAFQSEHSPEETWKLVAFIRHVPHISPEPAHHAHEHGDEQQAAHDHGGAAAVTIAMDGTGFQPPDVTVKVGQEVEWVNKDPFPHNVTFRGGSSPHSGDLQPDEHWDFRPDTPGVYEYVCTLHPGMHGVLHVTGQ